MTGPVTAEVAVRRSWSLRRWLLLVGTVSTAVTLVAIVVGGIALAQLNSARTALLDQLDPALLNAQALQSALLNQETGVRGYLSTELADFQAPYQQGREQQETVVANLRQLATISALPELTTGLDTLLVTVGAWQRDYAEPAIAAVVAGVPAQRPDPTIGKARFDEVRAALSAETSALRQARSVARARVDTAADALVAIAVVIAAGLVLLLAAVAVWTRRNVVRPIEALAGQVRTVAAGQFATVVRGTGPHELVGLATDVDTMRARIVAELLTVQALNRRLDELNNRLESRTADLARSNADLEQFAYVASHDLQEPLRKVSSFTELLAKRYEGQLDERADQYIFFAADGARRMITLINDLLAFSRVGRASTRDSWTQLDGQAVLDHALQHLSDPIERSGAQVTHDPMPVLVGEASLLVTVFQNLIGNGVKFHGDEPPAVHIGVRCDGADWEFRVSDNGIGVDPAYAERIFVIFQRLHAKDAYPGTGIGLALCKKIVEFHGGRIWLDPATTTGTAFCFTLPAPLEEEARS